jgi:hypothetical protein
VRVCRVRLSCPKLIAYQVSEDNVLSVVHIFTKPTDVIAHVAFRDATGAVKVVVADAAGAVFLLE